MFRKTDPKRCREVLLESIRWLKDRYIRLGEKEDLQKALLHIQAYGDLGFPYQDVETDLLEIFDSLGAKKEVRKAFRKLFCETIVINKSVINRLLGSWNPARQSMRIGDAVNDIIQKVTKKEERHLFVSLRKNSLHRTGEDGLWEHTFRLRIQDGEAIFHNVNQNRYYLLIKEGK